MVDALSFSVALSFNYPESREAQRRKIKISDISFIDFPLCVSGIKVTWRFIALMR